ncbi:hypothetical protein [Rhodoligotrophos defluvii]|uniref:hypothetical protein n=1 Tax=Rhodoligotrophos defluvii TaxID=2561934 RepID=UPI0010C9E195|nr:hypothetical protein [Rhodoligotrophos defluvii]
MMSAAKTDYVITRGDDWRQEIVLLDGNDAMIDLTGFAVAFAIDWPGGYLELTEGEGITVHAPLGTIVPALTPAQTRVLPLGRLTRYQLRLAAPLDPPDSLQPGLHTYLRGFLVVKPSLFEADQ